MYFGMCVSHYKCEEESKIRKIERLTKMGFKYLDGVSLPLGTPDDQVKDLKKCVEDNGIIPIQGGIPLKLWGSFDPDETLLHLDDAKKALDQSAFLGNRVACVLPAVWDEDYPLEVSWGQSIAYYRQVSDLAAARGLRLTCEVEPERDFITYEFHNAVKWIEHINRRNFHLNVDTGHFKMWKLPSGALRKYTDLAVHIHITETDGRKHQSWALGTGQVDNVGYINQMIAGGFEKNCEAFNIPPVACLELYIPDHTGPNYDEEIKQSIDWMQENLPFVKMK